MIFQGDTSIHGHIVLDFVSITHSGTGTDDDKSPEGCFRSTECHADETGCSTQKQNVSCQSQLIRPSLVSTVVVFGGDIDGS
jgi:hypothetical protein